MGSDMRTVLSEHLEARLEDSSYDIEPNRMVACGGAVTDSVELERVGKQYIIIHRRPISHEEENLAVAGTKNRDKILALMYDSAKRIAREIAKRHGYKMLDLTSRARNLSRDAYYYMSFEDYRKLKYLRASMKK